MDLPTERHDSCHMIVTRPQGRCLVTAVRTEQAHDSCRGIQTRPQNRCCATAVRMGVWCRPTSQRHVRGVWIQGRALRSSVKANWVCLWQEGARQQHHPQPRRAQRRRHTRHTLPPHTHTGPRLSAPQHPDSPRRSPSILCHFCTSSPWHPRHQSHATAAPNHARAALRVCMKEPNQVGPDKQLQRRPNRHAPKRHRIHDLPRPQRRRNHDPPRPQRPWLHTRPKTHGRHPTRRIRQKRPARRLARTARTGNRQPRVLPCTQMPAPQA